MQRYLCKLVVCVAVLVASIGQVHAAVIGIGNGQYYTNTLENNLVAQGHTVNVVGSYTPEVLSAFDVYIQDGNSFFDATYLDTFVFNGGTLIELPWSQTQKRLTANTVVIGPREVPEVGVSNPAITVLDSGSFLLDGVTLPSAGDYTISREFGNVFVAGNPVLEWADSTALLGYREYGAGRVVSFNLHLITSDANPLNAPWSNQIVYNAVNGPSVAPVPEPTSLAVFTIGGCVAGLGAARRRRCEKQQVATA